MTSERAQSTEREQAVRALEGAFIDLAGTIRRVHLEHAERVHPGLSPAAYKAVSVIERRGPISLSDLAAHVFSDKGLMSRTVTELESANLIERTQSPDDGRIRLIAVTDYGRERLIEARGPAGERMKRILAEWPDEDIERLTALLRAFTADSTL